MRAAWNKGLGVCKPSLCPWCGKQFTPIHRHGGLLTTTCSNKCASTMKYFVNSVFLSCVECRKSFRTTVGFLNYNKRYCSRVCAGSWKGGVTPEHVRIRNSEAYRVWRLSVFSRDNFTCTICGIRAHKGLGHTVRLEADHIKPFHSHPHLRLDLGNGRTLCSKCHRIQPTYGRPKTR